MRDAHPGDVLEVQIRDIQPGSWGVASAGPSYGAGTWLSLESEAIIPFRIDTATNLAVALSEPSFSIPLRPFLGIMGNAPALPGPHSTVPPRPTGGNIDCRELVAGSTLWLPVEVEGALFSVGDGHAVQGDGEVAGPAIEIPMERVELIIIVRHDLRYALPQAETSAGYLTFGFGDTLDVAMRDALAGMVAHLSKEYHLSRSQAVALASCAVSLRITQIVNGTLGVHALLPPDAFKS